MPDKSYDYKSMINDKWVLIRYPFIHKAINTLLIETFKRSVSVEHTDNAMVLKGYETLLLYSCPYLGMIMNIV